MTLTPEQVTHLRSLIAAEVELALMRRENAQPEVLYDQEEMADQSWDQFTESIS